MQVEGSLGTELAAAAKRAGKALGYRIVVTAVDLDELVQHHQGKTPSPASHPPPQLLSEGEVLVLPDRVVLGPLIPGDNAG